MLDEEETEMVTVAVTSATDTDGAPSAPPVVLPVRREQLANLSLRLDLSELHEDKGLLTPPPTAAPKMMTVTVTSKALQPTRPRPKSIFLTLDEC